ncbi:MAG: N-acetyltransferase family protein [Planctomycetota bacterium]
MPLPCSTRLATPADVPAITAIYNHAIDHSLATFWTEHRPESEIAAELAAGGGAHPWVVAELAADAGERVVGVAWSKRWNPRHGYDITCEVSVYTAHEARGQGVGTALYADLIPRLRDLGYQNVIGGVALPNDASVRLHERFGFQRVALFKRVGVKFGRTLDVGYWQLSLSTGAPAPGEPTSNEPTRKEHNADPLD